MNKRVESGSEDSENSEILTLPNIKYLVEGLEALLQTNLDGEKRSGVINLRDRLISITSSIINDFN
ncbi:MAG TPA: hypothetical protein VMS35_03160 [Nitrososphaeraceae archaeon]|nr:hypothetical protein [Nitrososphaeraceae archaeon]